MSRPLVFWDNTTQKRAPKEKEQAENNWLALKIGCVNHSAGSVLCCRAYLQEEQRTLRWLLRFTCRVLMWCECYWCFDTLWWLSARWLNEEERYERWSVPVMIVSHRTNICIHIHLSSCWHQPNIHVLYRFLILG